METLTATARLVLAPCAGVLAAMLALRAGRAHTARQNLRQLHADLAQARTTWTTQ